MMGGRRERGAVRVGADLRWNRVQTVPVGMEVGKDVSSLRFSGAAIFIDFFSFSFWNYRATYCPSRGE